MLNAGCRLTLNYLFQNADYDSFTYFLSAFLAAEYRISESRLGAPAIAIFRPLESE